MSETNLENAEYYYRKAIENYSNMIERGGPLEILIHSHHRRAECYMELNNYQNAYKDWKEALKLCDAKSDVPIMSRIYFARSLALFFEGKSELGIVDYQKAIELAPNIQEEYEREKGFE